MRSYLAYDQLIHVEYRAFPALCWLAAGYEVRVGGRLFQPRLGRWPFSVEHWTAFELETNGKRVSGMVRDISPWWMLTRRRYSLVVGLSELARDIQPVRGLSLTLLAVCVLLLLLLLVVGGVCGLVLVGRSLAHGGEWYSLTLPH